MGKGRDLVFFFLCFVFVCFVSLCLKGSLMYGRLVSLRLAKSDVNSSRSSLSQVLDCLQELPHLTFLRASLAILELTEIRFAFCLLGAGIEGVCHHVRHPLRLFGVLRRFLCSCDCCRNGLELTEIPLLP